MSRIELSTAMANAVSYRMLRTNFTTGTGNTASSGMPLFASGESGTNNSHGRITIMTGVMPTDTSAITIPSFRSSDVLVTFNSKSNGISMVSTKNVSTFSFDYMNASKSGAATWFWWASIAGTNATLYHSIIGSIGLLGSNADLEVNDTNVIAGNPYRITNMRITWPTTLDW